MVKQLIEYCKSHDMEYLGYLWNNAGDIVVVANNNVSKEIVINVIPVTSLIRLGIHMYKKIFEISDKYNEVRKNNGKKDY